MMRALLLTLLVVFASYTAVYAAGADVAEFTNDNVFVPLEEAVPGGADYSAYEGAKDAKEVQGLPQLDPTYYPSQIFWLLVTFAMMFLVFRFRVLPDLSSTIEVRREQIDGDLAAAKNLKEEAERIHAEYEEALTNARLKSSALFTHVEDKIKEKEQEEFAAFQKKSAQAVIDAEKDIAKASDKAMTDIKDHAAEIALLAADKIISVKADKKKAKAVIDDLEKKRAA